MRAPIGATFANASTIDLTRSQLFCLSMIKLDFWNSPKVLMTQACVFSDQEVLRRRSEMLESQSSESFMYRRMSIVSDVLQGCVRHHEGARDAGWKAEDAAPRSAWR